MAAFLIRDIIAKYAVCHTPAASAKRYVPRPQQNASVGRRQIVAGGNDELRIYVYELEQGLQHNMPPPPIPADMPPGAISEIDMLLAGLGLAGNSGDPKDMANGQAGFAQRGDKTGEAMSKFPANDQDSSKQLEQLMSSATQMPQQL